MPQGQLEPVLRHLHLMAGHAAARELTDEMLLDRYVRGRDGDAFAALVRRYGRLVLSVCRRVLRHDADADDAFQATFLVFATRAPSIRKAGSVASWLYGVAYRTAMNAKRLKQRRRETQGKPEGRASDRPILEAGLREVQAILYDEVNRLAEKHRAPFVLCCLEGFSKAEAAARLGWKEGTVSSRLARARQELQRRLARRGVALAAALCTIELSRTAATAAVAPPLMNAAIKAGLALSAGEAALPNLVSAKVAVLAKGALKTMLTTRLKMATVVLLVIGIVAVGMGALAQREPAPPQAQVPGEERKVPVDEALAKEKKFVVAGKVLTADGQTPLEGVEVWASAGVGSLQPTGETKTDKDGRFRLVFTSGILPVGGVAIVGIRKPGWHGWYHGWRPQYVLSDKPLDPRDVLDKYTNIVPGVASPLDFRMQQAASLTVKLNDGAGKPMVNTRVWLTGEALPPGASVVADGRTGADGTFTVKDVPRNSYRLVVIGDRDRDQADLELGSIRFKVAADYTADATIHEWTPGATHVSLKVTRGRDR